MNVGIHNRDEVFDKIRKLLLNGWTLISGEYSRIENFENEVYPPNTPKNSYFTAFMLQTVIGVYPVFLAKKNNDLLEFLNKISNFSKRDFNLLLEIHFKRSQIKFTVFDNEEEYNKAINEFLNMLRGIIR